jgi:hypothetical protein
MLFLLVFTTACVEKTDYGIIKNLYIRDTIVYWDDVEGATYYYIYDTDNDISDNIVYVGYTFASEFKWSEWLSENVEIVFKIKVFYEDKEPEYSDLITLKIETEFPKPGTLDWKNTDNTLNWSPSSEVEEFVNYALMINDEEITVEENSYDFSEYADGLFIIKVRSNYEKGSSIYTEPRYNYLSLESTRLDIEFDSDSSEDLVINFEDTENIVVMINPTVPAYEIIESVSGIFTIEDSYISVNDDYINYRIQFTQKHQECSHFSLRKANQVGG